MSNIIRLRCPKCGNWCKAEATGIIDRFFRAFEDNANEEALGDFFDVFDMKGAGKLLGKGLDLCNVLNIGEHLAGDRYKFQCSECKTKFSTDSNNEDMSEQYVLYKKALELGDELLNTSNLTKEFKNIFLLKAEELLAQVENTSGIDDVKAILHDIIAYSYYSFFNDHSNALLEINKSLDLCDDPQSHVLKGMFMNNVTTPEESYKKMEELLHLTECKNFIYIDKSIVEKELADTQDRYAENFVQIPPHQRKFLVITQEYKRLSNNLKVLRLDDFNKTKLTIPAGFVSKDTLYVCHPYKPNSYYPSTSYQTDLFEDQINELRELLQCLGAKSITTENARSNQKGLETEQGFEGEVGGKYKGVGGNLGMNHQNKQATAESIIQKKLINDEFDFNPDMSPFVPEGLFWFTHMGEWQRLARMRLRGQNKLAIFINEQQTHVVSNNEATQVNADFNTIVAAGHVQVSHNSAFQQSENSSKEFKLLVEFYPLSEYKKSSLLTNNLLSASSLQSDKATNNAKNNLLLYALFAIIGILTIIIMFFIL